MSTPALVGFLLGSSFVGLATVVVAGSALAEPGGWLALGLTLAWLLPLAGLAAQSWWRPASSVPLLTVAVLPPLAFGVWSLLDHRAARGWEDDHGPLSLVLLVVVAAGILPLGLRRPRPAAVLLLVVTLVPALMGVAGSGDEWPRELGIDLVTLPLVAAGVLYLVASRDPAPGAPPRTSPWR